MRNARTATGINAGELSEYALALEIMARSCGKPVSQVHSDVNAAAAAGATTATVGPIEYAFDGKTVVAVDEVQRHFSTPNVKVAELLAGVKTVVDQLPDPGAVTRAETLGGSSGKVDVNVVGSDCSYKVSAKYGNPSGARFQSPVWEKVARTYAAVGVDVSGMREEYVEWFDVFKAGGLRNSRAKNDYSDDLNAACELQLEIHRRMNDYVAANIATVFSVAGFSDGIAEVFCGSEESLYLVDVRSGNVKYLDRAQICSTVAASLDVSKIGATSTASASGHTLDLCVYNDGCLIANLRTTSSTNQRSGQPRADLRTPKPQTYVTPNLDAWPDLGRKPA